MKEYRSHLWDCDCSQCEQTRKAGLEYFEADPPACKNEGCEHEAESLGGRCERCEDVFSSSVKHER